MHLEFLHQFFSLSLPFIFISLGKMQYPIYGCSERISHTHSKTHIRYRNAVRCTRWKKICILIRNWCENWLNADDAVERMEICEFIYFDASLLFLFFKMICYLRRCETVFRLNSIYLLMCAQFNRNKIQSAALSRRHSFHFSTRNELETNLIDIFSVCVVLAVCVRTSRLYGAQCHSLRCDRQGDCCLDLCFCEIDGSRWC